MKRKTDSARYGAAIFRMALLLLFVASSSAFADRWVIASENFLITGRSRQDAIVRNIGESVGREFASREELEAFAADRRQKLENLRVFKSSSIDIQWPEGESTAGGAAARPLAEPREAILMTTITDGTAISPIPYAFFNSNDGLQSGIIVNMPNLAGTLQNLMLVGVYVAPPGEDDRLKWGDPNYVALVTWNNIAVGPFSLALTGMARRYKTDIVDRGDVMATYRETGGSGMAALSLPISGRLTNTVAAGYRAFPDIELISVSDDSYLEFGPYDSRLEIVDELVWSDFDWEGNFRSGVLSKAGISFTRSDATKAGIRNSFLVKTETAAYIPATDFVNPLFRVSAFAKTGNPELDAGSMTRGIRNNAMKGNLGACVNTGAQFKLLRFGGAELHLTPTLDFALAYAPDDDDYQTDWGFGAGSELMLIFDSMRSLPLRLGVAYDLRPGRFVRNDKRLEVDFNFTYTY